jgi:hypothetical protein
MLLTSSRPSQERMALIEKPFEKQPRPARADFSRPLRVPASSLPESLNTIRQRLPESILARDDLPEIEEIEVFCRNSLRAFGFTT